MEKAVRGEGLFSGSVRTVICRQVGFQPSIVHRFIVPLHWWLLFLVLAPPSVGEVDDDGDNEKTNHTDHACNRRILTDNNQAGEDTEQTSNDTSSFLRYAFAFALDGAWCWPRGGVRHRFRVPYRIRQALEVRTASTFRVSLLPMVWALPLSNCSLFNVFAVQS